MNYFPSKADVRGGGCKKRCTEPAIDFNPYLNFLLDLNTFNCTPPTSNLPSTSSNNCKNAHVGRPKSGRPAGQKLDHSKLPSTVTAKEITGRLDKLETEISKIVRSVTKTIKAQEAIDQNNATTDEERSLLCRRLPKYQKSASKTNHKPTYELIPPECFEEERHLIERHPPNCHSRFQANHERDECNKLRDEFSATKTELAMLRDELSSQKADKSKSCDLQQRLQDEVSRREQTEKSLENYKKLTANLNMKLEAARDREQQVQAALVLKDATISNLTNMQNQNERLKEEIRRLHDNVIRAKDRECGGVTEAEIKKSVDDALKKASSKFTKYHTEEVTRLSQQLGMAQANVRDLQEKLEQADCTEQQLLKLENKYRHLEAELTACRSREDANKKNLDDALGRAAQIEELNKQKVEEIKTLQKTVQTMQKECEALQKLKNTVAVLHAEKTHSKTSKQILERLENDNRNLKEANSTLLNQLKQLEIEKNSSTIQLKQVEIEHAFQEEKSQREIQWRDERCESLNQQVNCLTETVKKKDKVIEELQELIKQLRQAVEDFSTKSSSNADAEYWKRRNRELEEIIDRLEARKDELKKQLADAESQLQESNKAHQIINAKWKEKTANINRLQVNFETQKVRLEAKTEELQQERDDALQKLEDLEEKLKEMESKTRLSQKIELQRLKSKYKQELANKDASVAAAEERSTELEEKMRQLMGEVALQKKETQGKFSRLGRFLQNFEQEF